MREPLSHPGQRALDVVERSAAAAGTAGFLADVVAGLSAEPKTLPAKYFYDAAGSALFEEITGLPEYYPTRAEIAVLRLHGSAIGALVPANGVLVEFGSGSSTKIRILLDHLPDLGTYVPVDVSAEWLRAEAGRLRADYPRFAVHPVVADFTRPFPLPAEAAARPKAGFFPGSTIGNFDPPEAVAFLAHARRVLGPGGTLNVGVDLVKDTAVLNAAYDDAAGVTARFNRNMLVRINRELGADFDLAAFSHRAFFNTAQSRIEMHLVSGTQQVVEVGRHRFTFRTGETIHTENSYKYTVEGFQGLARNAGWQPLQVWTDPDSLFSVHGLG